MTGKFTPMRGFVLVMMDPVQTQTTGGILLPGGRETRSQCCTVASCGEDITEVTDGDRIYIQLGDFKKIPPEFSPDAEHEYAIVKEDHIIGVFYV